jgi:hypothetical protein
MLCILLYKIQDKKFAASLSSEPIPTKKVVGKSNLRRQIKVRTSVLIKTMYDVRKTLSKV